MKWLSHLGLVLLALAWLPPGHYPPWPSFQGEFLAALGLLLLGLHQALDRPKRADRWPAIAAMGFFLALLPVLQWWGGQIHYLTDVVLAASYLAGVTLAIVLGWHGCPLPAAEATDAHFSRPAWQGDLLTGLFISLLVAAAVSVALALGQWAGWQAMWLADLRPGARPFGNLGQPNQLASLMGWGLVATLYLHERRSLGVLGAAVLAVWMALGLAMTQSRTAWVFSAGLLVFHLTFRRRAGLRTPPAAALMLAAGLALLVLAWPKLNQHLLLTDASAWQERLQPGVRSDLWDGLWLAIRQSPWLGWGWNQGVVAQYAAAAQGQGGGRMLDYAHNLAIDLALWVGLPMATLILAATLLWAWRQFRRCDTPEAWCLLAGLLVLAVHAMTEYPHAYLYFLLPAGLFLGALERLNLEARTLPIPRWVEPALLAVGLLLLGAIATAYLQVEEDERSVRFALARIGTPPPLGAASSGLMDLPVAYQHFRLDQVHGGMSPAELESMRQLVERRPFPPALLRYALAAGLNGRDDEARRALTALCHMHPAARCEEGRSAWRVAQERYPEIRSISPP